MTVENPQWHIPLFCDLQVDEGCVGHMTMDHVVPSMRIEVLSYARHRIQDIREAYVLEAGQRATISFDLRFIVLIIWTMAYDIKYKIIMIDVSQIVHHHSTHATTMLHARYHMKNSNNHIISF